MESFGSDIYEHPIDTSSDSPEQDVDISLLASLREEVQEVYMQTKENLSGVERLVFEMHAQVMGGSVGADGNIGYTDAERVAWG